MYGKISTLENKILHHRRWAAEFLRSALAAEARHQEYVTQGDDYLAGCLGKARDGHLETAAAYEERVVQAKRELALLEKPM